MPSPHFTLTISAGVVAWYAAIVSTVTSAVQFANFLRDRVGVKIKVQHNMETVNDPAHDGMTITMVTVTNTGRRPVTITNVGLRYLEHKGAIFTDMVPRVPCELTEGKYLTVFVDEDGLRFDEIRCFSAYDATGREYKYNFATWRKRTIWVIRRAYNRLRAKRAKRARRKGV